jgi:hypothetical protein
VYEHRHLPVLPPRAFAGRLLRHASWVAGLLGLSLFAGMLGFRTIEGMSWVDAFLNAAMLLGGMGPVFESPLSEAGKMFAGCYALYAGLAFIAVTGILLAPVVHRVLHRLHWDESSTRQSRRSSG